jgi:hypothetical protein
MVESLIHLCYLIYCDISDISVHFFIISPLTFRAENNPDQTLDPVSPIHFQPYYHHELEIISHGYILDEFGL